MKGNMNVLEPKCAAEESVKSSQHIILPPISEVSRKTRKDSSFTVQTVPICRDLQKSQPGLSHSQHTVLLPICNDAQKTCFKHAIQQRDSMESSKSFLKATHKSKKRKKVEKMPAVKNTAMSPESALRDFKSYLTIHEQKEIKNYKQVWYLGKMEKNVLCCYDTENGFYNAVISDHLAYRFEILEVIGTGYSGQVLKCVDHKTMELVAIKVIRSIDRVHQLGKAEVKILETLRELDKRNTANIVHMKGSFYFRNHLCIIFDLFEKDLHKALQEMGHCGFNEEEVRKYTLDVLECLQMLRKKKIVHGDLKPENILLYKKGREMHTAVGDFGGSYFMKQRDGPFIHTRYYMAPEMLLGKRCSPAIDMWSLGCVLAELHLGHCLFHGYDRVHQFTCIMKVLGIPPAELIKEAPKRNHFFDSDGIPFNIKDIECERTCLYKELNTKNMQFLDFVQRCLEYDPAKRITPEEALDHQWICRIRTKPVSVRKTTPDASVPSSNTKPVLMKRQKMPPAKLKPMLLKLVQC